MPLRDATASHALVCENATVLTTSAKLMRASVRSLHETLRVQRPAHQALLVVEQHLVDVAREPHRLVVERPRDEIDAGVRCAGSHGAQERRPEQHVAELVVLAHEKDSLQLSQIGQGLRALRTPQRARQSA